MSGSLYGMQGMGSTGTGMMPQQQQIPPGIMALLAQMRGQYGGMGPQGGMMPQGGGGGGMMPGAGGGMMPPGVPQGQPGMAGPPQPMPQQPGPGAGGLIPRGAPPQVQQPQNLMQQMGGLPALLQMLQRGGQTGLAPQGTPAGDAGGMNAGGVPGGMSPGFLQQFLAAMSGQGQGGA